jgi:hypothetical protein
VRAQQCGGGRAARAARALHSPKHDVPPGRPFSWRLAHASGGGGRAARAALRVRCARDSRVCAGRWM